MMLASALARVVDLDGQGLFATKGGIAMQLRMGDRARATARRGPGLRGDPGRLAELLDEGLREPYRNFWFRRGAIDDLPARPHVKKVRVQVSFTGRVLCSPQLGIAPLETGDEGVRHRATSTPSGSTARLVLVLAERWQIAQKLHAVTEPFPDGNENPGFRDLIDLQLLEAPSPEDGRRHAINLLDTQRHRNRR